MLGILYESYIHPVTILSTLPSAGVGALLALILTHTELSVIAMIGIILLIGLVKKNGILSVDFALAAERNEGKSPRDAIFEASLLRFRPILMTTFAAMLGALPLALGTGTGSELRRPLGITIIGGLVDEPGADSVHDSRGLPVLRPGAALVGSRARRPSRRAALSRSVPKDNMLQFLSNSRYRATAVPFRFAVVALALIASGCIKGPNYQRPVAAVPQTYKEAPPAGWKEAQPNDGVLRGKSGGRFSATNLSTLWRSRSTYPTRTCSRPKRSFAKRVAAVRISRSALFPTVTSSPSATGRQTSSQLSSSSNRRVTGGIYDIPVSASYTADVCGEPSIRSVTASANTAQSLAAALENARLLYQSGNSPQDYFTLHGLDGDHDLLQQAVQSYQEYLNLTKVRFAGGVGSDADVSEAQTQLDSTQAQLVDVDVERTQMEHAIAILIGKPPAELGIPRATIQGSGSPGFRWACLRLWLERRPDIADAERQAAAANQQIGIAKAAFFPTLTLAATAGVESKTMS